MDCKTCKETRKAIEPIPYIAHESEMARTERTIKRLWILCIVLVFVLVATNGAWLWYENQFEDVIIHAEQSADVGNNYAVGGDLIG